MELLMEAGESMTKLGLPCCICTAMYVPVIIPAVSCKSQLYFITCQSGKGRSTQPVETEVATLEVPQVLSLARFPKKVRVLHRLALVRTYCQFYHIRPFICVRA